MNQSKLFRIVENASKSSSLPCFHSSIRRTMSSSTSTTTTSTPFNNVGVVGLGLMGHGICQVAAASGLHSSVIAYEPKQEFLDKGRSRIENSISKLVSKGKLDSGKGDEILSSITYTTDASLLSDVDFVVEAVIENMDLKKDLYKTLGETCKPETIFASNTSSLSITDMAEISGRPDRFVGVHFFNPVQIMKLVEVIHTKYTDPDVFAKAFSWAQDIGKVAVKCGDTPGFIVNRLLVPNLLQSMLMVDRNDATVKDIDLSMQLGAGHPMGPLHLADYIGLDTCLFIVEGWVDKFPNEPAFVIPKSLKEKVDAGDLGRKSGKGFYHWDGDKRGNPV
mmetsp:Transcript_17757/g.21709  ORF Transcript_17757/g.21709 Transcript_17757/m.21709 type:complete len:335 (-) Transcript_17757:572-1576(-)